MDLNKEKLIEMDFIVAHKIIQQIEKQNKVDKTIKKNDKKNDKENKIEKNIRTYSKSCEFCGQNVIWCICKNDIY
tara:strand:- start:260 stop:484 length:225 start_codon:yes stop_codon:yes gene_type:complete